MAMWLGEGGSVDISLSAVTGGSEELPTMGVNVAVTYGRNDSVDLSTLQRVKVEYGDAEYIWFDEENHLAYDGSGKLLLSGSQFEKKFEKDFNGKYPAKALAKRTGVHEADIMDMWDTKRDLSANYGTLVHKALEVSHTYWNQVDQLDDMLEEDKGFERLLPSDLSVIVEEYFKFRRNITPGFVNSVIETEVRIKLENLTGVVDNLEWVKDGFYIWDYKITDEIKDVKYGKIKAKKYTLQQNFYRHILENVTKKKCLGMNLLVWDGVRWRKEEIENVNIEELL
jgi:ATP-dependent exoDNAse (exonuclease V) beta subunit